MANGTNWTKRKKNAYQQAWYNANKMYISKTNISNKAAKGIQLIQNQNQNQSNGTDNTQKAPTVSGSGKVFKTMDEAAKYFGVDKGGEYDTWKGNLTGNEYNGIWRYTGSTYIPMNDALRNGTTPAPDIAKAISGARAGLAKANLAEDIVVWRGSSSKLFGGGKLTVNDFNNMAKNGVIIHDSGFTSAGITRDKAWGKAYVMEIHVPAGQGRGQYVAPMSQHKREGEYLIHDGGDYVIRGARQENGRVIVVCDLKK